MVNGSCRQRWECLSLSHYTPILKRNSVSTVIIDGSNLYSSTFPLHVPNNMSILITAFLMELALIARCSLAPHHRHKFAFCTATSGGVHGSWHQFPHRVTLIRIFAVEESSHSRLEPPPRKISQRLVVRHEKLDSRCRSGRTRLAGRGT